MEAHCCSTSSPAAKLSVRKICTQNRSFVLSACPFPDLISEIKIVPATTDESVILLSTSTSICLERFENLESLSRSLRTTALQELQIKGCRKFQFLLKTDYGYASLAVLFYETSARKKEYGPSYWTSLALKLIEYLRWI
ncbi:hypothetical protein V6N13_140090 [Hibiscus sabdariffa]|uniref:Uncharacterized protein n=1 Tax=Hibiscus sabdariffa TaxID=183260 RepID=A0ABR2QB95_9ROSI